MMEIIVGSQKLSDAEKGTKKRWEDIRKGSPGATAAIVRLQIDALFHPHQFIQVRS